MAFDNYKKAFKRMLIALEPLCNYYERSKLYFVWDALKCHISYGVTPNEYVGFRFYIKSHLEKKEYYTARDEVRYESKFNDKIKAELFNRKELTLEIFKDYIQRGWLYTPSSSILDIQKFINSHNKIIVKPNNLSSGRGIHVYKSGERIEDLIKNECLLEEFVNQHPLLASINSSSVNTVRIYSVKTSKEIDIDKYEGWKKGNTIIFSASIRAGGKDAEVDNYHAGGVGYPIDIRYGFIKGEGKNIIGKRFSFHPSSGMKMIGLEIPNWEKLREYIFELNQVVEELRLIAWDIAITPDGFDLIEANVSGDPGFMQAPSEIGFKKLIKDAL